MNNLLPTTYLHFENSTEQMFAEENASVKFLNEGSGKPVIESKIEISRLSDAKIFSTYQPVNQRSIVLVHQLLFC